MDELTSAMEKFEKMRVDTGYIRKFMEDTFNGKGKNHRGRMAEFARWLKVDRALVTRVLKGQSVMPRSKMIKILKEYRA